MLVVEDLRKTYRSGKKRIEAVKGISFKAHEGEIFAILGPNGAGKTTTIKSILGLVIPDSGRIEVDGIDVLKNRKEALKRMSAVLEGNRNIHWRLTVEENLIYFSSLKGIGGKKLKERMKDVIEMFELAGKERQIAGQLSRGYQQRLALAIATLPDTPIILLDEPTLGLDVESSIEIRNLIKDLSRSGKLVVLSTHDMKLVEEIADRVMIINKGKVVALDEKKNLKEMFKRRAYRIVLEKKPSEKLLNMLKKYAIFHENEDGFVLDVDLSSQDALYDVFKILEIERPPIKSMESEEIDFEKVFMKIVRGD